jgi:antitoxin ParD1/3/4
MNVSLSSTFEAYIQRQLDEGTYNNASEIIREALRLKMQQDEIYQTRLESLRAAIIQGEESGDATPFDMQDIIQDAKKDAGLNA